ncbi:hypothetical protein D5835_20365 [Salmonella enterica subsp. enterica serovar Aba]|nr:hypothetical protein [Salmonella enterica subsp. enterica serovar Aba]EBY6828016.1 hypothetical protein [Salmonella enterica subsp. enterica serovar Aba]
MTNSKLTDETLSAWKMEAKISLGETAKDARDYSHHEAILALVTELQDRRKAGEWIPISEPPDNYRVVYCWSEDSEMGVEARYHHEEWIACHEDEEGEEENFTHWMELPKGPRQ